VIHYWTGHGTLCSLDNSVTQKANHTADECAVTCRYCLYMIDINNHPGKIPEPVR
jgi:hypothetical protein